MENVKWIKRDVLLEGGRLEKVLRSCSFGQKKIIEKVMLYRIREKSIKVLKVEYGYMF